MDITPAKWAPPGGKKWAIHHSNDRFVVRISLHVAHVYRICIKVSMETLHSSISSSYRLKHKYFIKYFTQNVHIKFSIAWIKYIT